ncbi:MAG TPA: UDP-N-acetylglucosamine 2-epimerase (non-hydrolyzing) [Terriglobales bacterium]|nr:UDP-N-acetylglucosamine 2-epimerase (non-hydrolyzing) [Terriglobales bacterium]
MRVAHVEAGLRSFDRSMPEEINRLLTDQLADLLFTPSEDGNRNLAREGVDAAKVHLVGNVMIDTLIRMLPEAQKHVPADLPKRFVLVTLHRPSNVDDLDWLQRMLSSLEGLSSELAVLFPVHPRTRQRMAQAGLNGFHRSSLRLMDPLPYISFLGLQQRATLVITDSGGIQEETTYLGTPCLTVRENTERPVTVEIGTNILVGREIDRVRSEAQRVLQGTARKGRIPPLWDGRASARIAKVLLSQ